MTPPEGEESTDRIDDLVERMSSLEGWLGSELGYKQTDPHARGNIRRHIEHTHSLVVVMKKHQDGMDMELVGDRQSMGIRTKVAILWHAHVYLISLVSVVLGFIIRGFIGMPPE